MRKFWLLIQVLILIIFGVNWQTVKATNNDFAYEIVARSDDTVLYQGSRVILWVKLKNTGTETWFNNSLTGDDGTKVDLQCQDNTDCPSFYTSGNWQEQNILRRMDEDKVAPGETGSFGFYATAGENLGVGDYILRVSPTTDDNYLINGVNISWRIKVLPKTVSSEIYAAEVVGPKEIILGIHDLDQLCADKTNQEATTLLHIGENNNIDVDCVRYLQTREVQVKFNIKNIGNVLWHNNGEIPIHIATFVPRDRNSTIYHDSWLSPNRPAAIADDNIGNGQETTVSFKVKVPNSTYNEMIESFWLVAENKQWFNNTGLMDVRIAKQTGEILPTEIDGCMDPDAENYDPDATNDNDSCIYDESDDENNDNDLIIDEDDNGQDINIDEDDGEDIDFNNDNGEDVDWNDDSGEEIDLSASKNEVININ